MTEFSNSHTHQHDHGDGGVCVKFRFKASRFCSYVVLNEPPKILTKNAVFVEIECSLLGYFIKGYRWVKK